jgi:hypothetical protein
MPAVVKKCHFIEETADTGEKAEHADATIGMAPSRTSEVEAGGTGARGGGESPGPRLTIWVVRVFTIAEQWIDP